MNLLVGWLLASLFRRIGESERAFDAVTWIVVAVCLVGAFLGLGILLGSAL